MRLDHKNTIVRCLPEFLVYCFVAECTFGASGRWLEIGPLSIRMVLFILAFAATLPQVLRRLKEVIRHPMVRISLIFAVMLIIAASIGLVRGNKKSFLWADISKFLTLALLPGMLVTIDSGRKLQRLMNVIFYSAVAVGLVTAGLYLILSFVDEHQIVAINNWINSHHLGGLASMKTGTQRVYMRSQVFLPFAIIYGVWMAGNAKGKYRLVLEILLGLLAYALVVTMTRGLWLGLAVGALAVLILQWKNRWQLLKILGVAVLAFAVLTGLTLVCYRGPYFLVEIVNRIDSNLIHYSGSFHETLPPEVGELVEENNASAMLLRDRSVAFMLQNIRKWPILGSGLGTNLDSIRNDGNVEYMYLDMLMKLGAVGFAVFAVCFFLPVAVHLVKLWRHRKMQAPWDFDCTHNTFLVVAYLGTAVVSIFNPFLTSPMGITMLFTVILGVSLAKESNNEMR